MHKQRHLHDALPTLETVDNQRLTKSNEAHSPTLLTRVIQRKPCNGFVCFLFKSSSHYYFMIYHQCLFVSSTHRFSEFCTFQAYK